jgi:ATP-binding cassette subfamily A (ABC1) protein 3
VILSIPQLDLLNIADVLEWIFIILFPNYNLGQGLNDIYQNAVLSDICEQLVPYCILGPNPCCKGKILLCSCFFSSNFFRFVFLGR